MPPNENDACCVYWVKDATCVDPYQHGYIGLTKNLDTRSRAHLRSGRFPSSATIEVLFRGTRRQCALEENKYRQQPDTGWNSSHGGGRWRGRCDPA